MKGELKKKWGRSAAGAIELPWLARHDPQLLASANQWPPWKWEERQRLLIEITHILPRHGPTLHYYCLGTRCVCGCKLHTPHLLRLRRTHPQFPQISRVLYCPLISPSPPASGKGVPQTVSMPSRARVVFLGSFALRVAYRARHPCLSQAASTRTACPASTVVRAAPRVLHFRAPNNAAPL